MSAGPIPSGAAGGGRPRIIPVIMSGGAGTRLWPVSTPKTPKQFHALGPQAPGPQLTLLQQTLLRTLPDEAVQFLAPVLVCNGEHLALIQAQLEALSIAPAAIVLEPVGRSTAAVAAVAARVAGEIDSQACVLLLPADHVIADPGAFRAAVVRSAAMAARRIVTFGIEPTGPETGYGYIQRAEALAEGVYAVARFAEKPARELAQAYVADGRYAWNAGIFLFSPAVMVGEMQAYRPDILAAVDAALAAASSAGAVVRPDPALFARTPAESIDVAVMERTALSAVTPCSIGWADVGSWSELWRLGPHDEDLNLVRGDAVLLDSRGSLVWGDGVTVAAVGLSDMVVIASGGGVVVAPKSRAQEVKALVEALKARSPATEAT